ncbi:MAG: LamG-like jellyroll fold domain-containing protein, partial [Planctomycetota bacterium]
MAAQMYVRLNDSKVTYDGDPGDLTRIGWQTWNIDLASFGVDVQNVSTLSIGFDGHGATGRVLFDDIRLYPYSGELLTPIEPDQANLVAHWQFEGNFEDSSGNGHHGTHHGTGRGGPPFVEGRVGQAISFNGVNFVEIPGYKGIVGDGSETPPWSITAWVRTEAGGEVVGWGSTGNDNRMEFRINDGGRIVAQGGGGTTRGNTAINDGQWHHIAVTVQPNAVYNSGIDLWLDGQLDTRPSGAPDPWHPTTGFDVKIGIRYNG